MANLIFNSGKEGLLNGSIDLINDNLKVALMTNSFSPDIDADQFYSNLDNEVVGTGYAAGGKLITGKEVVKDDVNDRAKFDAYDLTWSLLTVSNVNSCVIYKYTGNPATSRVHVPSRGREPDSSRQGQHHAPEAR